jgi:hypothetical protein
VPHVQHTNTYIIMYLQIHFTCKKIRQCCHMFAKAYLHPGFRTNGTESGKSN